MRDHKERRCQFGDTLVNVCATILLSQLSADGGHRGTLSSFSGNTISIVFVLCKSAQSRSVYRILPTVLDFFLCTAQQALRAGPNASPPLNMKRALLFNGIFCVVGGFTSLLLKGEQKRKIQDEEKKQLSIAANTTNTAGTENAPAPTRQEA